MKTKALMALVLAAMVCMGNECDQSGDRQKRSIPKLMGAVWESLERKHRHLERPVHVFEVVDAIPKGEFQGSGSYKYADRKRLVRAVLKTLRSVGTVDRVGGSRLGTWVPIKPPLEMR